MGTLEEISICETDSCSDQYELMQECNCSNGMHGQTEEIIVKDSNGNILNDGDNVATIKDLTLRGSSQVIKQGTKASKIKLTDNPEEIDCKINGTAIVLRTEFVKKV
jgi:protein PhnA